MANPALGIVPLVVGFVDSSSGKSNAWSWDIGYGVSSTVQNPSHFCTADRTNTCLSVSNEAGSVTVVANNYIDVTSPSVTLALAREVEWSPLW